MSIAPPPGSSRISSYLCYEDAEAAIEWLQKALGFETRVRIEDGDGALVHCELEYAGGVVGIGGPDAKGKSPRALGGQYTQSLYVFVDTPIEEHHARAVAAGAEVVRELTSKDYGDRNYGVRDPEGHLWFFGQRVDQAAWDASLAEHDTARKGRA